MMMSLLQPVGNFSFLWTEHNLFSLPLKFVRRKWQWTQITAHSRKLWLYQLVLIKMTRNVQNQNQSLLHYLVSTERIEILSKLKSSVIKSNQTIYNVAKNKPGSTNHFPFSQNPQSNVLLRSNSAPKCNLSYINEKLTKLQSQKHMQADCHVFAGSFLCLKLLSILLLRTQLHHKISHKFNTQPH